MPSELDPRLMRVGIEVNGNINYYEGLDIVVSGTKYANPIQNDCNIIISNLSRETRDFILTETSPFAKPRTPKRVIVEAGRKSYGMSVIFRGDIISSVGGQPPDINLTLKCLTSNWEKGQIVSRPQPGTVQLKTIAEGVAKDLGLGLVYQAKPRTIANHSFNGAAAKQVEFMNKIGDINVYIDDTNLVVKDANVPLTGTMRLLDVDNGMIGVPEFTEQGVKVKFMYDGFTKLGSMLRVKSIVNPATNGDYSIYKLGFEIASRQEPFYLIAEGKRL